VSNKLFFATISHRSMTFPPPPPPSPSACYSICFHWENEVGFQVKCMQMKDSHQKFIFHPKEFQLQIIISLEYWFFTSIFVYFCIICCCWIHTSHITHIDNHCQCQYEKWRKIFTSLQPLNFKLYSIEHETCVLYFVDMNKYSINHNKVDLDIQFVIVIINTFHVRLPFFMRWTLLHLREF
jgi:hypothetical protein